ncbi:MAG: 3-methyl-2-oxobutanoate hydroxymethyltransferase [Polyangiaceae bacterium]
MLTAYDATFARLLDEGGADVLLVGDSLGMVVQGMGNTLPVTLEEICYHGRSVARGIQRAHLVLDMRSSELPGLQPKGAGGRGSSR